MKTNETMIYFLLVTFLKKKKVMKVSFSEKLCKYSSHSCVHNISLATTILLKIMSGSEKQKQ
jgi:hypothetical protein